MFTICHTCLPGIPCVPCFNDYDKQNSTPDGVVDYYLPQVLSANDYYPFGMGMPGRKFAEGNYRYGFNGKENDNDVKGEGNQQDYGMRIYDPRLGKFLSVDPLDNEFPWYSPYHFPGNNPIKNLDLDGGEPLDYVKNWIHKTMIINDNRRTGTEVEWDNQLGSYSYEAIYDKTTKQYWFVMQKPNNPTYYYWKHIDGADPNRLIQSTTGKLDNGQWVPFETQDQAQARIRKDVANGLAKFWYGMLATAITTGGRGFVWLAESLLEDALGVPIFNSPDDFARNQEKKEAGRLLTKSEMFGEFSKRMGNSVDNLAGKMDMSTDGTLYLSIDAILKGAKAAPNETFKKLTEVAEQMGKEQGAHSIQIKFNLVVNPRLANDASWAQEYGYYYSKQVDSQTRVTTVTWDKYLE